jgi:hypothetical protein
MLNELRVLGIESGSRIAKQKIKAQNVCPIGVFAIISGRPSKINASNAQGKSILN